MAESSSDGLIRARLLETHVENPTSTTPLLTKRQVADYINNIKIKVTQYSEEELNFDMIGVDPAIANTLRRILIAETPGMAIDHIFINQNTSIFQDEILAHRIGLIPIKADADDFKYRSADDLQGSDDDTIEFRLSVSCTRQSGNMKNRSSRKIKAERGAVNDIESVDRQPVLSKDLKWIARENQQLKYPKGFKPALDDIVIAKLVPGQEIDAVLHCVKGIGKDHAKFSPVGTAYYRFLPEIILKESIDGELATRLQKCFPKGVISIVDQGGKKCAKVGDVRKDNANGNVLLEEELCNKVELNKIKNHILFTVESIGMMPATQVVKMAFQVMIDKCETLITTLDGMYGINSE